MTASPLLVLSHVFFVLFTILNLIQIFTIFFAFPCSWQHCKCRYWFGKSGIITNYSFAIAFLTLILFIVFEVGDQVSYVQQDQTGIETFIYPCFLGLLSYCLRKGINIVWSKKTCDKTSSGKACLLYTSDAADE